MALYKRGNVWWFSFVWNGEHVQQSTKIKVGSRENVKAAEDVEAAYRTALAKGEIGIFERKPVPLFKDFVPRFKEAIHTAKPATLEYYGEKLRRLLQYDPLASAQLRTGLTSP